MAKNSVYGASGASVENSGDSVPKTRKGVRNGEAKPFEDRNGKFVFRLHLGRDENGRKLPPIVRRRDTPEEAVAAAYEELAERKSNGSMRPIQKAKGKHVESAVSPTITVSQYADVWLEWKRLRSGCAEVTTKNCETYLRLHVKPYIGHIKVVNVTREHIRWLLEDELPKKVGKNGQQLGYATLNHVYQTMKSMFERAKNVDGLLRENPVNITHKPPKPKQEDLIKTERVWERKNIAYKMIMDAYENRWLNPQEYVWIRLMFLGLRQGERGGLGFENIVNLDVPRMAYMNIEKQLVGEGKPADGDVRGAYLKDTLKTDSSRREIPIDEPLREVLLHLYTERQQLLASGQLKTWVGLKGDPRYDDLILLNPKGSPYYQQRDRERWADYLERWALREDITPFERKLLTDPWRGHINRKIAATMMREQGFDVETARHMMGHDHEAMTAYYTAFNVELARSDMNRLAMLQTGAGLGESQRMSYMDKHAEENRCVLTDDLRIINLNSGADMTEFGYDIIKGDVETGLLKPGSKFKLPDIAPMPTDSEMVEYGLDL